MNILDSMNEIWPSIHIIFKQKELLEKATETIVQGTEKLGEMPTEAANIIRFLNSMSRYELEEVGVIDTTATILQLKKVLTKRNIIDQLEERCEALELQVNRFTNRIEALMQKVLPSIYVINDKLITQDDYIQKMKEVTKSSIRCSEIKVSMTAKDFLEMMSNDFHVKNEVKHLFTMKPTFTKYTKVDEIYRKVTKLTVPNEKRWEELLNLLD